ncbi:MAG TPA: 6-phosphofructokinase [Clostridia bacterium]|nr:6-phosphofructokinase [Clostridia bacterium]
MKKIAVMTSGGDAPGMNACLRAVVRYGIYREYKIYGIERGYAGLIKGDIFQMYPRSVSDIIQRGGTILKTARSTEFKEAEVRAEAIENLRSRDIDNLVVIGGDGSFRGALALHQEFGINVIGIPGTIDNDLGYTDFSLGFDTAVNTVLGAINNLRDTNASHERVSIVEVMGRNCGDIALYAGLAGGCEYVLVPEIKADFREVAEKVITSAKRGKTSNMIVFAEGAGDKAELMRTIKEITGRTPTLTTLGHIQRGGAPSMVDRVLAAKFATQAVDLLCKGEGAKAVGIKDNKIFGIELENALTVKKEIDKNLYKAAQLLSL